MHESEIKSSKTADDWASFCREILLADFVDNFEPLGEGRTVEIDERNLGKENSGVATELKKIVGRPTTICKISII